MLINCKKLADAIQMFYDAVQTLKGMKMPGEHEEIFKGLLARIYFHGTAIYQLGRGTEIPEIKSQAHFWDNVSMTVLMRALLESAAQLNYLFLEQVNDDEREYRICYFRLRGLLVRQDTPASSPDEQTKQTNEQALIASLKTRIVQTAPYKAFTPKLQKKLIDGESDRQFEPSKTQLVKNFLYHPAVPPENARWIYAYLSDAAHSGYVSVFQVADPSSQKEAGNNDLQVTAMLVEMVTYRLALCYPPVLAYLEQAGVIQIPKQPGIPT